VCELSHDTINIASLEAGVLNRTFYHNVYILLTQADFLPSTDAA
jgi:hypothetical protein